MGPLDPQVTPWVSQDQINDRARAGGIPVAATPACLANVTRCVMTTRGRQMQGAWTELDWAVDLNPSFLSQRSHQPPDEGVFWGLLCAMARCLYFQCAQHSGCPESHIPNGRLTSC